MTTTQSSLGAFSVSLAVKDLAASQRFYGALGFEPMGIGDQKSFVILRNGITTIGLFQGLFEKNMLTFNPGWDATCQALTGFTDVREIQRKLRAAGIEPATPVEDGSGPGSFVVIDPDGNPILLDQHV